MNTSCVIVGAGIGGLSYYLTRNVMHSIILGAGAVALCALVGNTSVSSTDPFIAAIQANR